MSSAFLALLSILLVLPSANYHLFDGLPLSNVPEFGVLVLLLPVLLGRAPRACFRRFLDRRRSIGLIACLAAVLVLGLKVALVASETHSGFLACYRSPVAPPAHGRCERSYENPFFRLAVTRLDPVIDFGPADWNLSFFNSLRFNIYPWVKGNILRERLPLSADWQGATEADIPRVLEVTYVGEGRIRIGAIETFLPSQYRAPATALVSIPAGLQTLVIAYTFDDGYRVGAGDVPGPYATFRLRTQLQAPAGPQWQPLTPIGPSPVWRALARGADALSFLAVTVVVVFYSTILRRQLWLVPCVGGVAGALWASSYNQNIVFLSGAVLLMLYAAGRHRAGSLLFVYVSVVFLSLFRQALGAPWLRAVLYRTAGDDWLTYESLGRAILEAWTLEGGERVFHYQPLVRYVSFLEHLILGDGDGLIAAIIHGMLIYSVIWAFARLLPRGPDRRPGWLALYGLGGALLLALVNSEAVLVFTRFGASEVPTWIALPAALPLLFASRSARCWVVGASLLGMSLLARANQAIGLLFAMTVFLTRACAIDRKRAIRPLALFCIIASLPAAHNLYYGGKLVLMTTSGRIPENLDLPPARLASALLQGDSRSWHQVAEKIRYMFHLLGAGSLLLQAALHGLQIIWIASFVVLLSFTPKPRIPLVLGLLPLAYLGVHLFFQIAVYYPRHIIIGHIAMALSSMYAAAFAIEKDRLHRRSLENPPT